MTVPFFTSADTLPMKDVVLDLDDFAENPGNSREALELLIKEKKKFPKLKVTLFAIPFYQDKDNSPYFKEVLKEHGDWIEMAVHGWHHETPTECINWTYDEAKEKIQKALDMGCFVKGFKAPGWQISRETYRAVRDLGLWISDHTISAYTEKGVLNVDRRPADIKLYSVEHPWIIHGHTWDLTNPDPRYRNGIRQILEEHDQMWDENTNFHFISEVA